MCTKARKLNSMHAAAHNREDLVGEGVQRALREGVLAGREQLYLQTKYTPLGGQDPARTPYDRAATVPQQVGPPWAAL